MTKAFAGAIARRPPHGRNTTDRAEMHNQIVLVGSSAAVPLGLPDNGSGRWYTFCATVNCYIVFGRANMPAADATGWPLIAGAVYEWWCESNIDPYFRVISGGTDGNLAWYVSD